MLQQMTKLNLMEFTIDLLEVLNNMKISRDNTLIEQYDKSISTPKVTINLTSIVKTMKDLKDGISTIDLKDYNLMNEQTEYSILNTLLSVFSRQYEYAESFFVNQTDLGETSPVFHEAAKTLLNYDLSVENFISFVNEFVTLHNE